MHTTTHLTRLAAGLTLATTVALGAAPAGALPVGGGTGGGGTGTASITGTITTGTCDSTPRVSATWSIGGVAASGTASVVRTSAGRFTYRLFTTAPTAVTVRGTAPSTCPYGTWTRQSGSVSVTDGASVTGPTLGYVPPRKITTVPGFIVANAARSALATMRMHLNSYQSAIVNGSHYVAKTSYLDIAGTHTVIDVPNVSMAMRACGMCPSLGNAQFQVNDLNSATTSALWDPAGGLKFTLGFESSGVEVKGFYRNNTLNTVTDLLMPDLQINSATIKATLLPVLDGKGGITMAPQGSPRFSATTYATGSCTYVNFPYVDTCDLLFGYRSTVSSTFTQAALAGLQATELRDQVSAQFRSALDSFGVGTVRNVVTVGDDILVIE